MPEHMKIRKTVKKRSPYVVAILLTLLVLIAFISLLVVLPIRMNRPAEDSQTQTSDDTTPQEVATATVDDTVPQTPFAQMLSAGEISSIRLVGDSITAGYGTDGYVNADDEQTGKVIYDNGEGVVHYETSESAASWANAFRSWAHEQGIDNFVNAGINGAFMKQLGENPLAWIQEGADVIVVALGTNDAGYYGTDEFAEDARYALSAVKGRAKLVVVLSPVADLRDTSTLVESAASLGDVLAEICEEQGLVFCDTRPYVTAEMFGPDGLHPTTEGSLAIWKALRDTLGI